MNVNPIEQRPRDLTDIFLNLHLWADTLLIGVPIIAARAGVHCQSTGRVVLTAKRPKSPKLQDSLVPIGDHIRAKRLELGAAQSEVASSLGCDATTVRNWERNRSRPQLYLIPRIIEFLGYDPNPVSQETIGTKLLKFRKDRGMTQKDLARQIGIDPTTLSRMERNKGSKVFRTVLQKVQSFLSKQL